MQFSLEITVDPHTAPKDNLLMENKLETTVDKVLETSGSRFLTAVTRGRVSELTGADLEEARAYFSDVDNSRRVRQINVELRARLLKAMK